MPLKSVVFFHSETAFQPYVDMYETEDHLIFEVDLPGIRPDDVLIKVCGDTVIIEGIKRGHREERVLNYLCMERKFTSFRRLLKLPVAVDPTAGKAFYTEGVLTLKFPKTGNRVIKIKVET